MEKIIAAFDGLKYAESTEKYATTLASEANRVLTGIFLEDFTYHSYKLFDMVGSQGVSAEKVHSLMGDDTRKRQAAVERFAKACTDCGIGRVIHQDKGIAIQELLRETIYADLLVISSQETLSHLEEAVPTRFMRDLMIDVQCPVFAVPQAFVPIEKIILLFSADPSSVFAAKMFTYLLPEFTLLPTEVVTVHEEQLDGHPEGGKLAQEFIDSHFRKAHFTSLKGDPEEVILRHVEEQENALVVLGAYGRSMVSRWFKPSMADYLMKNVSLPLFITHYR